MTRAEIEAAVDRRREDVLRKTPYFQIEGERLLCVIPPLTEDRSAGGIIIPGVAQQNPHYGWVLSVGTGEKVEKRFKVGNYIIWGKYSGTAFDWGDAQLRLIEGRDVWGYFDDLVIIAGMERLISMTEAGVPIIR